jgi:hypothetical protein
MTDTGSPDTDLDGSGLNGGDVNPAESEADCFHDECGVFGIFGKQDAAAVVTLGLHALQHRGQEAAGIVSFNGQQFRSSAMSA